MKVPAQQQLAELVFFVREEKVILDADLAVYQCTESGCKTEPEQVSERLYVSPHRERVEELAVTNCDCIQGRNKYAITNCDRIPAKCCGSSIRLHRTRRGYAFECIAFDARRGSKYRDYAHLRSIAAANGLQ